MSLEQNLSLLMFHGAQDVGISLADSIVWNTLSITGDFAKRQVTLTTI